MLNFKKTYIITIHPLSEIKLNFTCENFREQGEIIINYYSRYFIRGS